MMPAAPSHSAAHPAQHPVPRHGSASHPAAVPLDYECDYDSSRRGSPAAHELAELFRYRDLLHQLVARNIKVRYKRSTLGVVWSMLSPLLTTVVLSIVFLTIFRPVTPYYPVYGSLSVAGR